MASAPPPEHTADQVVGIARRVITVDDEDARLVMAIQFCEQASSCCSADWLCLLAQESPVGAWSTQSLPTTSLLDEVLLFVLIALFAPLGTTAGDVLHCPADCQCSTWRSSAALPSERVHRYGNPESGL